MLQPISFNVNITGRISFVAAASHDNDDDYDDDDDNELFLSTKSYFQLRPLSEILTVVNLYTPGARFEPVQNLSSDFDESGCAVVITATPRCHNELMPCHN